MATSAQAVLAPLQDLLEGSGKLRGTFHRRPAFKDSYQEDEDRSDVLILRSLKGLKDRPKVTRLVLELLLGLVTLPAQCRALFVALQKCRL